MAQLKTVSEEQIIKRIKFENPWWSTGAIDSFYDKMKPRLYFNVFLPLISGKVKRAVVLMGPRRVGKTVILFHTIRELIHSGIDPHKICYLSIETPLYNNIGLEQLFDLCRKAVKDDSTKGFYVFFDEIQYLKQWEIHLKSLVDSYHETKFIASGSAAAALKLKSNESGAGRFTDFLLPPLNFCEYIDLKDLNSLIFTPRIENPERDFTTHIVALNEHFIDYINFGGYPEVILSEEVQNNPGRYIRNDIVDKVLLRDLPSLYGISNVQELNSLFTTIAYNSGNEMSYENLSQRSGVNKETLKRYITYLESAFLIKIVHKVDNTANRFKRTSLFKIYLTNPSLRSALFSPVTGEDDFIGNMVETAIFAQWLLELYYARWKTGEVDIVGLNNRQKPAFAIEVKWSNRFFDNPAELKNLIKFCKENELAQALVTTIDIEGTKEINDVKIDYLPASIYCYSLGKNALNGKINPVRLLPTYKNKGI